MSDLTDLYQEVIFDHNKRPRNFGRLFEPNRFAKGFNPLCGDKITLYVLVDNGVISNVSFEGQGCAISTASASLLTETLKGKTEAEAHELFKDFRAMITTDDAQPTEAMGKLEVMSGVREFPARVKCATLAWHTLEAALKNEHDSVSTE